MFVCRNAAVEMMNCSMAASLFIRFLGTFFLSQILLFPSYFFFLAIDEVLQNEVFHGEDTFDLIIHYFLICAEYFVAPFMWSCESWSTTFTGAIVLIDN